MAFGKQRRAVLGAAAVVGVLLVVAVAVWAWIHVPALYPPLAASGDRTVDAADRATRSQAIVTTRASVLAALAGLGALITIGINYRNSQTTNRTFRITERGHLTDRYTKAIEQLGARKTAESVEDGSLAIRLGGIYALQQFATETDHSEDQRTVVEVLSAFVRASLPRNAADSPDTDQLGADDRDDATPEPESGNDYSEREEPSLDVVAAISALARLPVRIDLRADFTGVDFSALTLRDADLHGARLHRAAFRYTNLVNADLTDADLTLVDFGEANLVGADLRGAVLIAAGFHNATLRHADLRGAFLNGPTVRSTSFRNADLRDADLRGTDLRDVDLRGVDLRGAEGDGADLTGADLTGANLRGARLIHGQLSLEQRAAARNVPYEPLGGGTWQ